MAMRKRRTQNEIDDADEIPSVDVLTWDEGRVLFDREAKKALGISGEEFLKRWDAGEYRPVPDTPESWKIGTLVMMIPFVRPTKV